MQYRHIEMISDLGSGMNYRKKGQRRLVTHILTGQVARIVLVTKDRLLRFSGELLSISARTSMSRWEILDVETDISREQQLTEVLVEILTVFSSRLYVSRSRKICAL